jgi:hypothetical protein
VWHEEWEKDWRRRWHRVNRYGGIFCPYENNKAIKGIKYVKNMMDLKWKMNCIEIDPNGRIVMTCLQTAKVATAYNPTNPFFKPTHTP